MGGTNSFSNELGSLPPGRIYFSIPCWGAVLSSRSGNLTIKQRRFVVREESRLVGTFKAEMLDPEDELLSLGGARVRKGGFDGQIFEADQGSGRTRQ